MEICLTNHLCLALFLSVCIKSTGLAVTEVDLLLAIEATTFTNYMTFTTLYFSSSISTMDKILS